MNKLKKIAALVLTSALALSFTACGSNTATSSASASSAASGAASAASDNSAVAKIKSAGTLKMVTNAEFEPFEFKDNNNITGIDVDICQKIADELGVKLEITDIAFDSCIPSVQGGKADLAVAGITANEERKKSVDFTDSYFNASQAIIVAKGSDIKGRTDLNGKTVGVQQGTTGDTYCTDEKGENDIKVKEVKRYAKGMDAVSDLVNGRIDAVVIDNYPAEKLVAKNTDKLQKLDESLTEEEYAIAVAKGSDLTTEINSVIKELKSNGELDKIVDKYITD